MRKQLNVLLTAVLAAAVLAGCGAPKDAKKESANETVNGAANGTPQDTSEKDAKGAAAGSGTTSAAQGGNGKSPDSGEPTELRVAWWGNQQRTDATIEVFDQFAEKNNVNFTYEYNSFNSYWETLATQSVGNNMPDIITQVTDQYAGYINNGLLIDLTPYVENKTLDLSDCEDAYISGGYYNGGCYGVPLGTNVMTIIYNPELFKAAGVAEPEGDWTWSDFVKTARTIYEKTGVKTENVAVGMPRYLLEPMIRSKGQSVYSDDGKQFGFDDATKAEIVQVIQDCYDLVQEGVFVDPEEQLLWKDNSERALCKGEAAMGMNWSSVFTTFSGYYDLNLAMATQPVFDGATKKGMYLRPAQFFSITKDCKNPEKAAEAISYFVNDPEANKILNGERGIPAVSGIRAQLKETAGDTDKQVYEFMDYVIGYCRDADPTDPSNSKQCVEILNNNVNEVMYGQMTAQECIDSWMEQSLDVLAK